MPELPEVETIRLGLQPLVEGALITGVTLARPDLRFPFPDRFAERLTGRRIVHARRRAKYLLFALSDGATWLTHLGMTGSFHFEGTTSAEPTRYHRTAGAPRHEHVTLALEHPGRGPLHLVYADPRRFGFMDVYEDEAACSFLAGLGPEPLGNELTAQGLAPRLAGRRGPIKTALLDQRLIAGLGNIYVCEALFRAGLAPECPAGVLVAAQGGPRPELDRLVAAIRDVLGDALAAGGSTLRDFRNADGGTGYFQHRFDVYDKAGAPCPREGCTGTVARIVQSGRSSFFCPVCQRTPAAVGDGRKQLTGA